MHNQIWHVYKQSNNSQQFFGKQIQPEALFIWSLVKQPQRHRAGGFAACFLNQKRKAVKGWTVAHPTYQHHPVSVVKYYELSWALFHFDHWAYSSPTLYSPPCFFESCIIWISKLVLPSHCIVPPRWRVSRGSEDDMWAWGAIYRKDLVWNQKISSIPQLFWTVYLDGMLN